MLAGGATEEDVIVAMLSPADFPSYQSRLAIAPGVFVMRALDAAFVSQSVPSTMTAGKSARMALTFRNTGSMTWDLGQYGVECPDKCAWSPMALTLANSVGPGKTYTFEFTILAPTTPGAYYSSWQMFRLQPPNAGVFGQKSTTVPVQVVRSSALRNLLVSGRVSQTQP